MRLNRLNLIRYGQFTDVVMDLPENNPDFHIIYGPNEAGKSTTLNAIEDLLFGIPNNSPMNFLHNYSSMRIGATLKQGDDTLEIQRRKGRKDTLLTPDGIPFPAGDRALTSFLRGADRNFLQRMFSLDHARLFQGGREFLDAQDEIGQMLFSAGSGLGGLRNTLNKLQEEADELWASRRASRRKYFQAEDRLKEADQALRAHTVTAAKWRELKRAYDDAQEKHEVLNKKFEDKFSAQQKLNRIRRIYRDIHRKAKLDRKMADLVNIPEFAADALNILQSAENDDAKATARIDTLKSQLDTAILERGALTFDEKLTLREQDIRELCERRISVRNGKADLPKRRDELDRVGVELCQLAMELNWGPNDMDELSKRIPDRGKVSTARAHLNRFRERLSAVESAKISVDEATAKVSELQNRLQRRGDTSDVSVLAAVYRSTRTSDVNITLRIHTAALELEDAKAHIHQSLDLLRPRVANEKILQSFSVPPHDTVQTYRDSLREFNQRLLDCQRRIGNTNQEIKKYRKNRQLLERDNEVVANEDIVHARAHRNTGWSLIRRSYVDDTSISKDDILAFTNSEKSIIDTYEEAVSSADMLADKRFNNAEASAHLTEINRKLAEQEEVLNILNEEASELNNQQTARRTKWRKMWTEAPFEPLSPDEMLEWLSYRTAILHAVEKRQKIERQHAALLQEESQIRVQLIDELATAGVVLDTQKNLSLAVILEIAADKLRQNEVEIEAQRQLDESHRQEIAELDRKNTTLKTAEEALLQWKEQWADVLAAAGLDPKTDPEAADDQLEAIDRMRTRFDKHNELRHERIGKIERDIKVFDQDVSTLTENIVPDLSGNQPEEVMIEIDRRLAEAKRTKDKQQEKEDTITSLEQQIAESEITGYKALEDIDRLKNIGGVTDIDQLKTVIGKSDEMRKLKLEHKQLLQTLETESDGLNIVELEKECESADLDQVTAHEASLTQEIMILKEQLQEATECKMAARRNLETVSGEDAAAQAASARQEALAEMQGVAEQYTRVRSAAILLQWAIEQYRKEKQEPLLKHAGSLFSTLTSGSFTRLRVDYNDHDKPMLMGVRSDTETVAVSGMSTGTADQLYLSIRIASVMDYLDRAEPLPFIADDLFINFDDTRTTAGVEALGQLANRTQVILFTHHQRLVEIATAALGTSSHVVTLN